MIEIQSGCVRSRTEDNTWLYSTVSSGKKGNEDVVFETITFVAENGDKPEIGDFIQGGKLVKCTVHKVNPDWSKWKDKDLYGNP